MITTRNMKITKENNLTDKGKYIIKIVGQPLINLVRELKDKSIKLIQIHNSHMQFIYTQTYIYVVIYEPYDNQKPKSYNRYTHTQ